MKVTELPPVESKVENLDESETLFLPCDGYQISEWHPERDGAGKPTAVVMRVPISVPGLPPFEVALRLKSADAVDTLIATLMRHRNNVWGG